MLQITVKAGELFDDSTQEFITIEKDQILELEHSLISLSKWESKWHKPFLTKEERTIEETIDYIRCMTLTQKVDPNVYRLLSNKNIEEINEYIKDPMTATTIKNNGPQGGSREIVTSEIIYYDMVALNIPFECQKWHLNRLLTLIRVCDIKNQPQKKMSQGDIMRSNAALNAARKKQLNTKG